MNVYKVTLCIVDHDGVGERGICEEIENANYGNDCIAPSVEAIEVRDIGEWDDDHPLNQTDTSAAEFRRLFGDEP